MYKLFIFLILTNFKICYASIDDSTKNEYKFTLDRINDSTKYNDSLSCYLLIHLQSKSLTSYKDNILLIDTNKINPDSMDMPARCAIQVVNHDIYKEFIVLINRLTKIQCSYKEPLWNNTFINIILYDNNDPIRNIYLLCDQQIYEMNSLLNKYLSGYWHILEDFIEYYEESKQKK